MAKKRDKKRFNQQPSVPDKKTGAFPVFWVILIVALFSSVYIHSFSEGFYDHDEFGHYVQLKSMDSNLFFSIWGRAGFKLPYLIFKNAPLDAIRTMNLILLMGACFLLYKLKNIYLTLVILTFPFIHQIGARFYSEILCLHLIILAIYFLKNERYGIFSIILSYCFMIRMETALMAIPAIMIMKNQPKKNILLLFLFPFLFYLLSIILLGSVSEFIEKYINFSRDVRWKGDDILHYTKAMVAMSGIWVLFAFPSILESFRKRDFTFFMGVSTVLLLLFYTLSYWKKTGFGPIIGIERHVLLTAPMIAYFASASLEKYKALIVPAILIILALPVIKLDGELVAVRSACSFVNTIKYNHLYNEHGFVNYCLDKPISGPDISRFNDFQNVRSGDVVIWDSHYGIRKVPYETFSQGWQLLWKYDKGNVWVLVFRKE
ncbi:hypothetical protein JW948_04070 [bacterium]|nr:hypothetical protein [bacterium]